MLCPDFGFRIPCASNRNQWSLEKWLILGLTLGIYERNLEPLLSQRSSKLLRLLGCFKRDKNKLLLAKDEIIWASKRIEMWRSLVYDTPNICHSSVRIILSWRLLRNTRYRKKFFALSHLPKVRTKDYLCDSVPFSYTRKGKITFITGVGYGTKMRRHKQALLKWPLSSINFSSYICLCTIYHLYEPKPLFLCLVTSPQIYCPLLKQM